MNLNSISKIAVCVFLASLFFSLSVGVADSADIHLYDEVPFFITSEECIDYIGDSGYFVDLSQTAYSAIVYVADKEEVFGHSAQVSYRFIDDKLDSVQIDFLNFSNNTDPTDCLTLYHSLLDKLDIEYGKPNFQYLWKKREVSDDSVFYSYPNNGDIRNQQYIDSILKPNDDKDTIAIVDVYESIVFSIGKILFDSEIPAYAISLTYSSFDIEDNLDRIFMDRVFFENLP